MLSRFEERSLIPTRRFIRKFLGKYKILEITHRAALERELSSDSLKVERRAAVAQPINVNTQVRSLLELSVEVYPPHPTSGSPESSFRE